MPDAKMTKTTYICSKNILSLRRAVFDRDKPKNPDKFAVKDRSP